MKKVLFVFLVISVFLGSISVSAGILTRTKLRLLEKGSDIYSILDQEYTDSENAPAEFVKVRALSELAVDYLYSGTHETTFAMLKDAELICENMNSGYYKAYGYAEIACAYAEFKNMLGVREMAKAAADKGIAVVEKLYNKNEKVRMYNGYIRILMNLRYYKQVNELIVKAIDELENVNDVYYRSLCALDLSAFVSIMKDNKPLVDELFNEAYNTTQNMNDSFLRSIILCEIADYSFIRNTEKAELFLEESINAAFDTTDSYYSGKAFSKIAKIMIVNGKIEKVNEIIANSMNAINGTDHGYYRALGLADIAGIYYVTDNKIKAYELLAVCENEIAGIEDSTLKVLVSNEIFWVYYIFEDEDKALEVNNNALNYADTLKSLTVVADNYAILRDFDKADMVLAEIK
jgi:hypothetical protein